MFESAVDCLDGAVGGTDIEVGEHIFASSPQGASQLGELLQAFR